MPMGWQVRARACCGAVTSTTRASCSWPWPAESTAICAAGGAAPASRRRGELPPSSPWLRRSARANWTICGFRSRRTTPFRCAAPRIRSGVPGRPSGRGNGQALVSLRALLWVSGAHPMAHEGHRGAGSRWPVITGCLHLSARNASSGPPAAPLPAPLPAAESLIHIGTGTNVLGAVLARRGVAHVVATDLDPRALACARENLARLGVALEVELTETGPLSARPRGAHRLQPALAARAAEFHRSSGGSTTRTAGQTLRGFLGGLAGRCTRGGEGWLVLSDLAERLQPRSRAQLLAMIAGAGLEVIDCTRAWPMHRKSTDGGTNRCAMRVPPRSTSLWRLRAAGAAVAR